MPRELLSAGIALDPDTERERELRMETLKSELGRLLRDGKSDAVLDGVSSMLIALERENERLAWRLLRAERYRFGRNTEKLSQQELGELFAALGGSDGTAQKSTELPVPAAAAPEESLDDGKVDDDKSAPIPPEPDPKKKKRRKKKGGSLVIGPDVQRILEPMLQVSESERHCALCGRPKTPLAVRTHERIEYIPAQIIVRVEQREQCACACCRTDVSIAERSPEAAVSSRRVGPSLLAKMVVDKCANAMPLHRQRQELARLGLEITDKTFDSYWAYTLDTLEPVAIATLAEALARPIVGADDTHLKTLDRTAKNGVTRGRLWCFVGTDGRVESDEIVAYGYAKSWSATELREWFSAIDGIVQCDAYAGYATEIEDPDGGEPFVAVPDERRLGCGMHVRSKFHAALLAKDKRAAVPLKHFADLYAIEAECKQHGLPADERTAVRRERSIPILNEFDRWVDSIHPRLLPKSPLRVATEYATNQRPFLRRCFEDGRFEIDNGRTERAIRPFAVGRRNFLFTGSVRGGERLAVAYTLVDNCLRRGLDPQTYLEDVLRKIERGWPLRRLSELVPHRWTPNQTAQ